jgi:DNA-directed RNA polymerase specialized sigma24 family protein
MPLDRFSRQLYLAFEAARETGDGHLGATALDEPALSGLTLDGLVRRARNTRVPLADQGTLWAAVLRSYRRGPADFWGPVLLEMLAPSLVRLAARLTPLPPTIGPADIQQQLVIEALEAAQQIPARDGSPVVKRWLSLEIRRRVGRWLAREALRQAESLEAVAYEEPGSLPEIDDDAVWELADLRTSGLGISDLALLIRLDVRGERLADVARQLGCTPKALDCRRWRARRRLNRRMAA